MSYHDICRSCTVSDVYQNVSTCIRMGTCVSEWRSHISRTYHTYHEHITHITHITDITNISDSYQHLSHISGQRFISVCIEAGCVYQVRRCVCVSHDIMTYHEVSHTVCDILRYYCDILARVARGRSRALALTIACILLVLCVVLPCRASQLR